MKTVQGASVSKSSWQAGRKCLLVARRRLAHRELAQDLLKLENRIMCFLCRFETEEALCCPELLPWALAGALPAQPSRGIGYTSAIPPAPTCLSSVHKYTWETFWPFYQEDFYTVWTIKHLDNSTLSSGKLDLISCVLKLVANLEVFLY